MKKIEIRLEVEVDEDTSGIVIVPTNDRSSLALEGEKPTAAKKGAVILKPLCGGGIEAGCGWDCGSGVKLLVSEEEYNTSPNKNES